MFARTPRLLLRPGFPEDAPALAGAIADQAIVRNLADGAVALLACVTRKPISRARAIPVLPSLLIFERGTGAPQLVGCVRPRPPPLRLGRARLLDRPVLLGPRLRDRSLHGAGRHRPRRSACRASKDRTSPTTRRRRGCSTSSVSTRSGIVAPRMSCARGEEVPARLMRLELRPERFGEDEEEALAA